MLFLIFVCFNNFEESDILPSPSNCKFILSAKIDVEKNNKISDALRIKVLPTLMIYKTGEMVWRQSGEQDANTLIGLMKEYLD